MPVRVIILTRILTLLLLIGALGGLLASPGAYSQSTQPATPTLSLTAEQWRQDLRLFAEELPKRHANAFHYISKERFDSEVADLDRRLPLLNGDEAYAGLDRIANLIGDGHTYIDLPSDDANFPIDISRFGNDYRIDAIKTGYEKALGARVLRIDETPIAKAAELLLQLTPADETESLRERRVEAFLTTGMLLHGMRITADRNVARYTLADDSGAEFTIEARPMKPAEEQPLPWIWAFKERPLYRQKPGNSFWYTYLPEYKAVYCSFRGYRTLATDSPGLFKLIADENPEKLIVDMRLNGGGDYWEGLKHVIGPIRALSNINKKGHLFVIIGPSTFSAAMSNSAQFRSQTEAILVGEPIGERPNSYQEVKQLTLPNSHLVVRYSTKYYKFVEGGENLIRPDQLVPTTWEDFRAGKDPVLEWILNYHSK